MILGVTFRVRDLGVAVNTALSRAAPRRAHISTVPRKPVYSRPQRRRRSRSRRRFSRAQQQQNSRHRSNRSRTSSSLTQTATTQLANSLLTPLRSRFPLLTPLRSRFSCSPRLATHLPATKICSRPQIQSSSRGTPCLVMHARSATRC